ncbi:NADP-dependent oxidoreductase [Pseudomaricurvus alcaniphilus]|uniref:NADP-dependent oxidoreductase n=1 Tax=Pseudomaricurvus alcaniphilus TaxID=1166482 RepID=UPI0014081D40|nr:NADP-dependent oxidoreductase [Pseudomaricurvus alcaniphilus]NHN36530.1 NADP-dependent oxidoreductase [Pseudomaricurvus alcaniphilus]
MKNRQIILSSRPVGVPQPRHFNLIDTDIPALQAGEFLVENIYLSVDPAQRGYVNDENNYAPPVAIGGVMRAVAVGRVVESNSDSYAVGEYLYGWFGWQDYCVATAALVFLRINPGRAPLSTNLGLLGMNGLTAYIALHDIGKPKAGDTVLVTAAAGAVGSIVGQLAKLEGCRTVAVTSSDEKGQHCIDDYGYDAFINYHKPLDEGLRATCPDGVDVFFDNVAGVIGDAVYQHMAWFGRIIQCGTISIPSWVPPPEGPRKEREILTRRLTVSGFVIFDHMDKLDSVVEVLAAMLADGKLHYQEDIGYRLEGAPQALVDVYAGRNTGKKLIQLRDYL